MRSVVASRFAIASARLDAAYLAKESPWRVIEAVTPRWERHVAARWALCAGGSDSAPRPLASLLHTSPPRPHPPCVDGEEVRLASTTSVRNQDPVRLVRTVNKFAKLPYIALAGSLTPSPTRQARGGRIRSIAYPSQSNCFTGGASPPGSDLCITTRRPRGGARHDDPASPTPRRRGG